MGRSFFDIAFTPAVMREQERHGSRSAYASFAARSAPGVDAELGPGEAAFIAAKDGFYMASVSQSGWPYLQFRGGPAGFVRVIDSETLAWADFRGDRQYISIGNVADDDRVALFFMDYRRGQRLKLLGHLSAREVASPANLTPGIPVVNYRAEIEHEITVKVTAFDWNCPQHIPQRFSAEEVELVVRPLQQRIQLLEQWLAEAGLSEPDTALPLE